jgi:hypothetical protein
MLVAAFLVLARVIVLATGCVLFVATARVSVRQNWLSLSHAKRTRLRGRTLFNIANDILNLSRPMPARSLWNANLSTFLRVLARGE